MNIDLIIEALEMYKGVTMVCDDGVDPCDYLPDCRANHKGCMVVDKTEEALAEARKLKPTTITDDPETWPEDSDWVVYRDRESSCICLSRRITDAMYHHGVYHPMTECIGDSWCIILSDWEDE